MKAYHRLRKGINYRIKSAAKMVLSKKTNTPYLSGDTFANISDLVINQKTLSKLSSETISSRPRIIFIESHLLPSIPNNFLADIKYKHIIIFGNSDFNFDTRPRINEWCSAVYCQNASFKLDQTFKLLPIGLENLKLCGSGFKRYHKVPNSFKIENKILFPPISPTNSSRSIFRQLAEGRLDLFDITPALLPRNKYFKLTKSYKFIFVPEGNGYDTHRLWEVLYQGSFPVAKRTLWSENVASLGIPIMLFDNLNELSVSNLKSFLALNRNYQPSECDILWIDFWKREFNFLLRP